MLFYFSDEATFFKNLLKRIKIITLKTNYINTVFKKLQTQITQFNILSFPGLAEKYTLKKIVINTKYSFPSSVNTGRTFFLFYIMFLVKYLKKRVNCIPPNREMQPKNLQSKHGHPAANKIQGGVKSNKCACSLPIKVFFFFLNWRVLT